MIFLFLFKCSISFIAVKWYHLSVKRYHTSRQIWKNIVLLIVLRWLFSLNIQNAIIVILKYINLIKMLWHLQNRRKNNTFWSIHILHVVTDVSAMYFLILNKIQRIICSVIRPDLESLLQLHFHRRNVDSPYRFYKYFYGNFYD